MITRGFKTNTLITRGMGIVQVIYGLVCRLPSFSMSCAATVVEAFTGIPTRYVFSRESVRRIFRND